MCNDANQWVDLTPLPPTTVPKIPNLTHIGIEILEDRTQLFFFMSRQCQLVIHTGRSSVEYPIYKGLFSSI
jgi:hypothetical protein